MLDGTLPVIVMTAWSSIELAVEAMRRGARDFVQSLGKYSPARHFAHANRIAPGAAAGSRLEAENRSARESRPTFLAKSPAMAPVLELIGQNRTSDANVLITGEHGTGKESSRELFMRCRACDEANGDVNAGGLSEGIFESELFGHVKGALPMRARTASGGSNSPTAARCSWTKSPTFAQPASQAFARSGNGGSRACRLVTTRRVNVRVLAALMRT